MTFHSFFLPCLSPSREPGRKYYYNHATNVSTWVKPNDKQSEDGEAGQGALSFVFLVCLAAWHQRLSKIPFAFAVAR